MKKILAKLKSMFWGDAPLYPPRSTLFIIYVAISTLMIVTSLILAQLSMPFFGVKIQGADILVSCSIITYPITYIVSDVMSECYGFSASIRTVWVTFIADLIFVLFLMVGAVLPVPGFETAQKGLIDLMGFGFLNGTGSIGAFGVFLLLSLHLLLAVGLIVLSLRFLKRKLQKKIANACSY